MSGSKESSEIKFSRCDGVSFPGNDFSNSICKEYVHKQIVVRDGDGEDDWHLEEKPVLVREFDIHKEIQVEAERNNLKALIAEVMRTGDESLLHQSNKVFADITAMPEDIIGMKKLADKSSKVIKNLPDSLKDKSMDELLAMTSEEILEAYGVKKEKVEVKDEIKPQEEVKKESEEK